MSSSPDTADPFTTTVKRVPEGRMSNWMNDALAPAPAARETVEAFWLRITGRDIHQCPHCGVGRLILIGTLPSPAPITPRARSP